MVESTESPYVPALRKGLNLLELLAEQGQMTLAQVERASGLNRTMAYRLLRVMDELGYVQHDPVRHHYQLGLRLLGIGAMAASQFELVQRAWPLLAEVRQETGETITLAVLASGHVVYLGMLHGQGGGEMITRFTGRRAAHTTAAGKAILAFLPPAARQAGISAQASANPQELESELIRTRERGFALADDEHGAGTRSVGVPILNSHGYAIAALGLSGASDRIDLANAGTIAARLRSASQELSRRVYSGEELSSQ